MSPAAEPRVCLKESARFYDPPPHLCFKTSLFRTSDFITGCDCDADSDYGFPAAVINIGSWPYGDPNYHSEGDIPERSDVPNAAKAVQATLAAVLTLDKAP